MSADKATSWDEKLFPDHVSFLKELHERNLKVTLNVHPADGVRSFEAPYEAMCNALSRDPKSNVVSIQHHAAAAGLWLTMPACAV
jgi:alpha-glucosidase (family GH31 glycosyl hydrolase)